MYNYMKHIFFAIPNYSGSTLIHNLVATSENVATLRKDAVVTNDFIEGNGIGGGGYKYKHISQLYTEELKTEILLPESHDWNIIKNNWNKEWSKKENASVYIQKTPMDIFRVKQMQEEFENLKWIIAVKEPYAYIESLFRKYMMLKLSKPYDNLDKLCAHVLLVLKTQLENKEFLGDRGYCTTLENFILNKEQHVEGIKNFTDNEVNIDLKKQLWVKGRTSGGITNTNEQKIQNLIGFFPDIISKINQYFIPNEDLLKTWGFSIRT